MQPFCSYDMHDAAADPNPGGVEACLAWREKWLAACIPAGGLGADIMGQTPLHVAAGVLWPCFSVFVCSAFRFGIFFGN